MYWRPADLPYRIDEDANQQGFSCRARVAVMGCILEEELRAVLDGDVEDGDECG